MKAKLILVLIILLFYFTVHSQDAVKDMFLRDDNGDIYLSEVVQVDGMTKDQLYHSSKTFFAEVFKSANNVIQMDDKHNGVLIGKGFSNVYAKASVRDGIFIILDFTATVQIWFTVKIQCKEGRFKYEIYNIYFIGNSEYADHNKSYPIEYIFNKERLIKKRSAKNVSICLNAVENEMQTLIASLKTTLSSNTVDDF